MPVLVETTVKEEIQKLDQMRQNEAMRFRFPKRVNEQTDADRKPFADIPFSYMRRMAQIYPIARACINRRIRQITQLDWDITTVDDIEGEDGFESQIQIVKQFFKHPFAGRSRLRELLTIMVDDILTVDAISFEYQRTRGGEFMSLVPVDPTTIALRVTETGATPLPPEPAYVQFIQGQKIADFTTEELLYDMMGKRSYSPYGMAPLESLILQAESAIRGSLYNLAYFRENNVPEGFITLPDDVAGTKSIVEEWQLWFDSLLAGDNRTIHRLKFLPGGATYTPAKKPEDMAFERFELWLLQQTCAMFEVQPQDIGITLHVNKATSQSQSDIGVEKGLIPLSNFIKEIFDDLIQIELGFEFLQFEWGNMSPVDREEEVNVAQKEIDRGIKSVDEIRIAQGLEPIGLDHFVMTTSGPMFVKDLVSGAVGPSASLKQQEKAIEQGNVDNSGKNGTSQGGNGNQGNVDKPQNEEAAKMEMQELKRWRKCIYSDLEKGSELRTKFPSNYISSEVHEEISEGLKNVSSKMHAKVLFDQYLDPELKASMTLLKFAKKLREIEHDTSS